MAGVQVKHQLQPRLPRHQKENKGTLPSVEVYRIHDKPGRRKIVMCQSRSQVQRAEVANAVRLGTVLNSTALYA